MAVKLAVVAPAPKVIDAGTESRELLLLMATDDPPAGAAWEIVTVQFETAPASRPDVLQETADTDGT
jgi:hypothetical protein